MPVPSSIDDLSTTSGANSPAGSEGPQEGDNYLRQYGAFIALLRDKLNGTSDTGTIKNATFSGTMAGAAAWAALQTFAAGLSSTTGTFSGNVTAANLLSSTYAPTVTNVSDFASGAASTSTYARVGDRIHVALKATGNTGFNGLIRFRVTLPVASNFAADENCIGVANANSGAVCAPGVVYADITNDAAEIAFQNSSGAVFWTVRADFSYRML